MNLMTTFAKTYLDSLLSLYLLYYIILYYEGESVNRSEMDIESKICDIRNWTKHLYLEISSTNIDTLVPLLYQCVETRKI
jgi:hypothetical protein